MGRFKPFRLFAGILILVIMATPVLAIDNPDDIAFGTGDIPLYNVFENVVETGDMLFVAEGLVEYTVTPTDYSADEAFLFEVLDAFGAITLASTTLSDYGDRPISIYKTAAQVTDLGLVSGAAYWIRITGNPIIFPSPTGNTVTSVLGDGDYIDQSLATEASNPLRDFMILMADNIEAYDTPAVSYLTTVQGVRYLSIAGGDIFLAGVPGLSTFCPSLFQSGVEVIGGDIPTATGSYAAALAPTIQWGQTVGNGLASLGTYLGINQALAGSVVLFVIVMAFAVFIFKKTESGIAVLLLVSATPFVGAFLGLMSLTIAFVFVIFLVVIMSFFFFAKGAL